MILRGNFVVQNKHSQQLLDKVDELKKQALKELEEALSSLNLYEVKVKFLGRQGLISDIMKLLKDYSQKDRPLLGRSINEAKKDMESFYEQCNGKLQEQELDQKLKTSRIDMTIHGPAQGIGRQHPIEKAMSEIIDIFNRLGYCVQYGPMIDTDENCFTALNIPREHPARDMQDTFYIKDSDHKQYALRPHTSSIQIRTMRDNSLTPPFYILGPGSVFRRDSDISHSPMFHQIEGLVVDTDVSMAHLKGTLDFFAKEFFGKDAKIKFRPSFFPFTEPSAEVDCSCQLCSGRGCRMCGQTGWVEIAGCGLVHPNVLKHCSIDPQEWQGFAFGMGIERMAILKYRVQDIRLFFENDLRFLEPFY